MPPAFSLLWIGGVLEMVGGFLVLIGLFTRPVAFLLAGEMAVAYWMVHAPRNLFPALNGGDAAILYCFIFLFLVFAGPGALSVDGAQRERARPWWAPLRSTSPLPPAVKIGPLHLKVANLDRALA